LRFPSFKGLAFIGGLHSLDRGLLVASHLEGDNLPVVNACFRQASRLTFLSLAGIDCIRIYFITFSFLCQLPVHFDLWAVMHYNGA